MEDIFIIIKLYEMFKEKLSLNVLFRHYLFGFSLKLVIKQPDNAYFEQNFGCQRKKSPQNTVQNCGQKKNLNTNLKKSAPFKPLKPKQARAMSPKCGELVLHSEKQRIGANCRIGRLRTTRRPGTH